MRYLIIFLMLIGSAKAQIPVGILSQFSGVPLNKQIWVSFNTAANDAGFYVNRFNGLSQDLYNADQSQNLGSIQTFGSVNIEDRAGAMSPQVINGKYWLMGNGSELVLNFSPSTITGTAYVFWSNAASIDYVWDFGAGIQTLTVPNYPYTGAITGTPITITDAGLFYVLRNEPATVRFFALCIILD